MYKLKPITDRVSAMRAKYRDTRPEICIARYRLQTEFYMQHPELEGILRRAKAFRNICENIPIRIDPGEVIVGAQSSKYRACALYPENSVAWLKKELSDNTIQTRDIDPYIISDKDKEYVLSMIGYWMGECMSAKTDAQIIDEYFPHADNGILLFAAEGQSQSPVGHFVAGYETALHKGFAAIKAEAEEKKAQIVEEGMPADSVDRYNFYRSIAIICEGMITLTKRYAVLAAEHAAAEQDPKRKRELETMADALDHCMEHPARNYLEALQTIYMYQNCMCLDANMHAISFGRVDQYLIEYYENDISADLLTEEYAQELLDLFYLKVAELNKPWGYFHTSANPGYVSSMLMTLGGVKKDGTDASNAITYMMLQSMGRLVLHDPPQALRIHKGMPEELWEAAIETTKISGGVPSFENDDLIIPALMSRGLTLEDARNFSLIGCVEPSGTGNEWASPGGDGTNSYMNLANMFVLAINDGYYPMAKRPEAKEGEPTPLPQRKGLPTGYLYGMETFDDVLEAVKNQIEYFVKWQAININSFEYIARQILPQPTISATMDGCMEKGMDVMFGGARYNSTGMSAVGVGNIVDSLAMIKHLCFDTKKCTARELFDALKANWEGYEDLLSYIKNEAPHYGNGLPECDVYAKWVSDILSNACNSCTGPRGRFSAGLYPVTTHVLLGMFTSATPDGRYSGEPLADGISAVQQMDTNGPTAILKSVANIEQVNYPNGTLLNMKFHPNALNGEDGIRKVTDLIRAYFDLGGMQIQINVVSAETLRTAQKNPEEYKNLVVRVAGFSAYFIELQAAGQEDLIRRTELAM